ncbi:MAG: hypothetical protein KKF30_08770 [Proteobacteria bacterium]|nr:hypothetical protein [Pseudomonadota bacterium]MBU4469339.1 hypothetical protein [Pseudomonadota bacterium]MCG2753555.1 hypothetical protein [Desulfobacteraceae bacterium]
MENVETGQTVEHDEDYYRQAEYEKLQEDEYLEQKAAIQKAKDHYKTKAWEYNREIKRSSEQLKANQKERETEATRRNVRRLENEKNRYENLKKGMYTQDGRKWADKNAQDVQAELEKEKARLRDVELHGN